MFFSGVFTWFIQVFFRACYLLHILALDGRLRQLNGPPEHSRAGNNLTILVLRV
jgi:hypothetical protein